MQNRTKVGIAAAALLLFLLFAGAAYMYYEDMGSPASTASGDQDSGSCQGDRIETDSKYLGATDGQFHCQPYCATIVNDGTPGKPKNRLEGGGQPAWVHYANGYGVQCAKTDRAPGNMPLGGCSDEGGVCLTPDVVTCCWVSGTDNTKTCGSQVRDTCTGELGGIVFDGSAKQCTAQIQSLDCGGGSSSSKGTTYCCYKHQSGKKLTRCDPSPISTTKCDSLGGSKYDDSDSCNANCASDAKGSCTLSYSNGAKDKWNAGCRDGLTQQACMNDAFKDKIDKMRKNGLVPEVQWHKDEKC